jgi:hypothetical protein
MNPDKPGVQDAAERLKANWLIALVIWTVAVVGATWTVAEKRI